MSSRWSRFGALVRALRSAGELASHDRWDAATLRDHQQRRLDALVAHARERSPFWREQLRGQPAEGVELGSLPVLDKRTMLQRFDELVTDRRLRRAELERHLARAGVEELHLGEYHVMASGGSSGERGIFVYGSRDWHGVLSGVLRATSHMHGVKPRLPVRRRLALVMAKSATHMTARTGASLDAGVHRLLRLDARMPLPELTRALNAYQPDVISAYATSAALLADEQLAGRLSIRPSIVSTTSEVRTPAIVERIVSAWGVAPLDVYATSETGILATECASHRGMHLLTDQTLVEVVDAAGAPVAPGVQGHRLLVTSLGNYTQPLIRYELTDLVTLSPEACPCGRPFPLMRALDGRSDDVLTMEAAGGGSVSVHPLTLRSPLTGLSGLRQYRILHDDAGLTLELVADADAQALGTRAAAALTEALAAAGVRPPPIRVEPVAEIARHPESGKTRLVERRTSQPDATSTRAAG